MTGMQSWCLALALSCHAAVAGADAACDASRVDLRGPSGRAQFSVEVVDTPAERARGLMFREDMARSAGMLFVYEAPQAAVFWMENTLIPLDMIFADASGRVTHVHSDARPLDRTPIDGGEGVQFVLEVNGGLAARLGIGPGPRCGTPQFPRTPPSGPARPRAWARFIGLSAVWGFSTRQPAVREAPVGA